MINKQINLNFDITLTKNKQKIKFECYTNDDNTISVDTYIKSKDMYINSDDLIKEQLTEFGLSKEEIKKCVTKEVTDFIENGFCEELREHCFEYNKLWDMADIKIDCDEDLNKAIRFNIFHLMSTGSSTNNSINIGAKLLTGEEYGGHAFWDTELFMCFSGYCKKSR